MARTKKDVGPKAKPDRKPKAAPKGTAAKTRPRTKRGASPDASLEERTSKRRDSNPFQGPASRDQDQAVMQRFFTASSSKPDGDASAGSVGVAAKDSIASVAKPAAPPHIESQKNENECTLDDERAAHSELKSSCLELSVWPSQGVDMSLTNVIAHFRALARDLSSKEYGKHISDFIGSLEEEQFQKLFQEAKLHPLLKRHEEDINGSNREDGAPVPESQWYFGCDSGDVLEDLVGFIEWLVPYETVSTDQAGFFILPLIVAINQHASCSQF